MTSLPAFPVEDQLLEEQRKALLALQEKDGHFCFELEADCTIPAEYVLLKHFVGTPDVEREPSIATYLKRRQNDDGSWPLFYSGAGDISCSVKAYWALS
ncbi:MAG: squalene--hopene cyclase, partial [Pseudomonadota bacterium]